LTKTLLYQNKEIHYRTYGSGKPVLLIHGFGEDSNVWKNQIEYLKDRYYLIVPDLPGSGRSEMIDDMSMEGMAEVMMEVIKAFLPSKGEAPLNPPQGGTLESERSNVSPVFDESKNPPLEGREAWGAFPLEGREARVAVIGHSMGGYITLAFAEKYPDSYSALGLFHSSAFADGEEKKATRRKGIEFIREHGAFEFLKTAIPNLFSPDSKEKDPDSIRKFIEEQHNFSPNALVSYYEAMMRRPDRTLVLHKATEPVLFIMGKYDNAVLMADMLEQCHLPEKSYIHILRKSGHMGMMEEPDACSRILDKFLLEI
jgi:pimeloyl-ACP methyl ester carboxylesterase